eukprot:6489272-Amphidinium_carterae.1
MVVHAQIAYIDNKWTSQSRGNFPKCAQGSDEKKRQTSMTQYEKKSHHHNKYLLYCHDNV